MSYYIDIKEEANIFLAKIDENTRFKLKKAIFELSEYPQTKGKILPFSGNSGLTFFEKRLFFGGGYRVYYTVLPQNVVIDKIVYDGTSSIHNIGDKKSQKKDLKILRSKK
jgi:mRNA-degrading endonuclease RelE of RelBE toxin-antitoxin system